MAIADARPKLQLASDAVSAPVDDTWQDQLQKGNQGAILGSLRNAVLILSCEECWRSVLAFNQFSYRVEKRAKPPFEHGEPGAWTDNDDSEAAIWIANQYGINIKTSTVAEAVRTVANRNAFHPVRDYLESCEWDQRERLPKMLSYYFGAELNDYTAAAGTKTMIAAVARVMDPGCKADCMLILEGAQGQGKSSAIRILAGEFFLDTPLALGDKDSYQVLRGKWIVELAELESLRRAREATQIKQFLSAPVDTYRASYARTAQDYPRQCIFIGSTNQDAYLQDETGARRFWPVNCKGIDLPAISKDRNQLWAEALHRFKSGERWWVEADESDLFASEQEARYTADSWESMLAEHLDHNHVKEISVGDALLSAFYKSKADITRADESRLGRCFVRLGWKKHRLAGKGRLWVYRRE